MARKLHWQIAFTSLDGEKLTVNIYDDGYTGDVVTLVGASAPFETEDKDDSDILLPSRTQSGYIRIIDTGYSADVVAITNDSHFVTLVDSRNNIKWQGYQAAQEFDCDLWDIHTEIEFPIFSALELLDMKEMPVDDLGIITFGALVAECLQAAGCDWKNIIYPKEIQQYDYSDCWSVQILKGNLFSKGDKDVEDPEFSLYDRPTYLKVIENICTLYGWTIMERQQDIWFVSRNVTEYLSCTSDDFYICDYSGAVDVTANHIDLTTLNAVSTNQTSGLLDGYRMCKVWGEVNATENSISLPESGLPNVTNREWFSYVGNHDSKQRVWYGWGFPRIDTPRLTTHGYLFHAVSGGVDDSGNPVDYYYENYRGKVEKPVQCYPGYVLAEMVFKDIALASEITEHNKTDWNPQYGMYVDVSYARNSLGTIRPSDTDIKACPIFTIRSLYDIYLDRSGALSVNVELEDIGHGTGGTLLAKLQVGNRYWNDTSKCWTESETYFEMNLTRDDKTIYKPFKDAKGIIAEAGGSTLSGKVSLTIYPSMVMNQVFKEVNIGIHLPEDYLLGSKEKNIYYLETGFVSKQVKEMEVFAITYDSNAYGLALLYYNGSILKDGLMFNGEAQRPEIALLKTMLKVYGRATKKLSVDMEKSTCRPGDIIEYDGSKYMVISEKSNWRDNSSTLILEDVIYANH